MFATSSPSPDVGGTVSSWRLSKRAPRFCSSPFSSAKMSGEGGKAAPKTVPQTRLKATNFRYRFMLASHIVHALNHLIGSLHDLLVRFIGALRQDHLHKLVDHADVGRLDHALLQRAQTFRAAGRP